jgi:hypothetical protein
MIRLTELSCTAQVAVAKVEGNLTGDTLQILGQTLADYQQRGIGAVNLVADGVVSIDRLALEAWLRDNPPQIELSFLTSRVLLHQLLGNCGLKVVLQ